MGRLWSVVRVGWRSLRRSAMAFRFFWVFSVFLRFARTLPRRGLRLGAIALVTGLISVHLASFPAVAITPPSAPTAAQTAAPKTALPTAQNAFDQGQQYYQIGDYEQAILQLEQAIARYRQNDGPNDNPLALAVALSNLSLVQQQLGRWPEARAAIDESLSLLRRVKADAATQASVLDIQASLQLALGQTEVALSTWQQTEQLYQQVSAQAESGFAANRQIQSRINQAQALRILGFYGRARQILRSVQATLPALAPTDPPEAKRLRALYLRLLGDAQRLSGTAAEAQTTLKESLRLALESGDRATQAAVQLSLAHAYRTETRAAGYQRALELYEATAANATTDELRLKAQINQLSLRAELGDIATAQRQLQAIFPAVQALPGHQSGVYSRIYLAQLLLDQAALGTDRALGVGLGMGQRRLETLLLDTVEIATQLGDRRSLSYAQGTLGQFYEKTGAVNAALRLTNQALQNAQSLSAADIGYRWNWQLGRLLQRSNRLADAILAYDDAIADLDRLRSDLVSVNRDVQFSFRKTVEPVYRESVGLLIQAEAQTRAQNKNQDPNKNQTSNKSLIDPPKSNLEQARERIEALQLAELDNFFREACLDGQSVLLDKVVDQDNPTTAIIYPIILDDRLEVIIKIPGQSDLQFRTVNSTREAVSQVLSELDDSLRRRGRARTTRQKARQVYDWLIDPFEAQLKTAGVDTLVFVLDGPLRSIPMAALYSGDRYLIEDYAVAVSLGLQLLEPKAIAQENLNILAAGLVNPPADPLNFRALPNVETELRLINETGIDNQQLLNEEFTRDRLAQAVQQEGFNVVHLATHGKFSSSAENTFILAADGRIQVTELDGLLRGRSETRDAAIEMLILSACETAAGDDRAALGLAGIAVKAGARSTLASLWQIDDFSTSVMMGEFYKNIAQNTAQTKAEIPPTKAQALRTAQLSLLEDRDLEDPYFWAPYILVGNWL